MLVYTCLGIYPERNPPRGWQWLSLGGWHWRNYIYFFILIVDTVVFLIFALPFLWDLSAHCLWLRGPPSEKAYYSAPLTLDLAVDAIGQQDMGRSDTYDVGAKALKTIVGSASFIFLLREQHIPMGLILQPVSWSGDTEQSLADPLPV